MIRKLSSEFLALMLGSKQIYEALNVQRVISKSYLQGYYFNAT